MNILEIAPTNMVIQKEYCDKISRKGGAALALSESVSPQYAPQRSRTIKGQISNNGLSKSPKTQAIGQFSFNLMEAGSYMQCRGVVRDRYGLMVHLYQSRNDYEQVHGSE